MSSSFSQRYGRKYGKNTLYEGDKAFSWGNPIWRRERIKSLRAKHIRREKRQANPNYWVDLFKEKYPHWDFRTEADKGVDYTRSCR